MAMFDPALVTEDPDDQAALARQIAVFANADTTAPLPGNSDAWQLDLELRNFSKPVGNAKLWGTYSVICAQAVPMITGGAARARILMEEMNGARRVPDADWNRVKLLLDQLKGAIDEVFLESHRLRLQELLDYHRGIVARYVGDYLRAAVQQDLAAQQAEASGNLVGVVIARLSEQVERVNHALSVGEDPYVSLELLRQRAQELVLVCVDDKDANQVAWRCFSAPIHVLEGSIWCGIAPIPQETQFWFGQFEELQTRDPDRHQKHLARIAAVNAGFMLLRGDRRGAHKLANEVVTAMPDAAPEALSTARVVLAVLAMHEHLGAIDGVGAHMWQLRRLARDVLSGHRTVWPPRIVSGDRCRATG